MRCPTCDQEMPVGDDTFATRLRDARVNQSLTRGELAEVLGYERTSVITRWESGGLVPRDTEIIETIAQALDTTPAWLLYGVQEPKLFTEPSDAVLVPSEYVMDEFVEDEVEGDPVIADESGDDDWDEWVEDDEPETTASGKARPSILKQLEGES